MRTHRMKWKKASAALLMGMLLVNVGNCLPKDYFYRFAAAGQSSILDAFGEFVFGSITDALFPSADGDTDGDIDTARLR